MGIINTIIDLVFPMKKVLEYGFMGLMLLIDGIVYNFISMLFSLFEALAGVQLLSNEIYEQIASTVYLFVGIIALFVLTFSLLKNLVDVDTTKNTIKSFKSIVIALVLIILMPTIFKYAFSFQNAIISDGVIGKVFQIALATDSDNENSMISWCNFSTDKDVEIKDIKDENGIFPLDGSVVVSRMQCQANYTTMTVLEGFLRIKDDTQNLFGTKWINAKKYIIYTGNFSYITSFVKAIMDGEGATYIFIISTIAGLFCAYVILSFCIDLGVRSAKLAFYQLISPIPILMSIIPNKQDMLNKWSKQTINCFLEVFVRLLIINFIFFMCSNIFEIIDSLQGFESVNLLGKAILVLGLFSFGKQAPKLLKDALSLNGDGVKLGIKGKLEDNLAGKVVNKGVNKLTGAVTGGLGAGWTSMANGGKFVDGVKYGGLSGWQKGGQQFQKQRQGLYTSLGFKGKAGYFGGQSFVEKSIDSMKSQSSDNIQKDLKKWVDDYENNNSQFLQTKANYMNQIKNEHQRQYNELANVLKQESKIYEDEEQRIRNLQQQASANFQNAQEEIKKLKQQYIISTPEQQQVIQQKIDNLEKVKYDKSYYESKIVENNIKRENDSQLDDIKRQMAIHGKYLSENSETLKEEARLKARTDMMKVDMKYDNIVTAVEKIEQRGKVKAQLNSVEGQANIEAMKKAFEAMDKDKKK